MGVAVKLTECISSCPRLSDDDCNDIRHLYLVITIKFLIYTSLNIIFEVDWRNQLN